MVNTLRRKKDKETPAVVDTNGSVSNDSSPASTLTSAPALAVLQTSAAVDEKNRTVAAPVKVHFSLILFVSYSSFWLNVITTACLYLANLAFSQLFIFCLDV